MIIINVQKVIERLPSTKMGPAESRSENYLRTEEDFERSDKPKYQPTEKPKQIGDNVCLEEDFKRPAERRTPMKHNDNLRTEGGSERPEKLGSNLKEISNNLTNLNIN